MGALFAGILTQLTACKSVTIKDSQWCGDMGADGAVCFSSVSGATVELDKAAWDAERFGQICTKAETFADWKSVIEKLCAASGECAFETQQQVETFAQKIERLARNANQRSRRKALTLEP